MKFAVAVAQIDPRPGELSTNLQMHLELARQAAGKGARCIVFPELSLTGYHLPGGYAGVALSREHSLLEPLLELSGRIDLMLNNQNAKNGASRTPESLPAHLQGI